MTSARARAIARTLLTARGAERRRLLAASHPIEVARVLKLEADQALGADSHEALRIATVACRVGESSTDPLATVLGYHALAKANHAVGRHAAAVRLYARAGRGYRTLKLPLERARVRLAEAAALAHLGHEAAAERAAREAATTLRRGGDQPGAARALINLANLRFVQDQHREAIQLLERARPMLGEADDLIRCHVDLNLANSKSARAQFEATTALYSQARAGYQALGRDDMVARVDYNHAYDDFLQGQVHQARQRLGAARTRFRSVGIEHGVALAALDEAEMSRLVGDDQKAFELADEARAILAHEGEHYACLRAAIIAASAGVAVGDARRATAILELARAMLRRGKDQAPRAELDLLIASHGAVSAAIRRRAALRARKSFAHLGLVDRAIAADLTLADDLASRSNATTLRLLTAALRRSRRHHLPDLEIRAEHAIGKHWNQNARPDFALRHHRRAIAAYERLRSGVHADPDRLGLARRREPIFRDALRAALDLGDIEAAFAIVEQARARALVDLLAGDHRFTDAALAGSGNLGVRLRRLKRDLARLTSADHRAGDRRLDPSPAPEDRNQRLRLAQQFDETYARLAKHSPIASYAVTGSPVAEHTEVMARLGDRALVSYFVDDGNVGVLLSYGNTLSVRRNLAPLVTVERLLENLHFTIRSERLRGALNDSRHSAALAVLRALGALLFEPFIGELGDRPVVIVPHATLHHIPFHALYCGPRPTIADREVTLTPSATVLLHTLNRTGARGRPVVFAAPNERAPRIHDEALAVADLLGARLVSGVDANAKAVSELGRGAAVLHFSAHGIFDAEMPSLSGIQLHDGRLTSVEIAALGLDAELITVAACDTARGTRDGDEVLGLARAFLHAGTRALLSSLWAVDDDAAATFMLRFYRDLVSGQAVAAAHRAATIALLAVRPHPCHWAPFVVFGSWDALPSGALPPRESSQPGVSP